MNQADDNEKVYASQFDLNPMITLLFTINLELRSDFNQIVCFVART